MQAGERQSEFHADSGDIELGMCIAQKNGAVSREDGHQSALGFVDRGEEHRGVRNLNVMASPEDGFGLGLEHWREAGLGVVAREPEEAERPIVDFDHEEVMVASFTRGLDLADRMATSQQQIPRTRAECLLVFHVLQGPSPFSR